MDEVVFRAEQALESLQVHLNMATENGLRMVRQYSDEGRNAAFRALNDPIFENAKSAGRNLLISLQNLFNRLHEAAREVADPTIIYEQFGIFFRDEIYRNNAFFVCVGLAFGTTGGFLLGVWLARPHITAPLMKAIACVSYRESENVTLCSREVPRLYNSTDILVRVRAVSIHRLDERIANGYGRTLRCLLNNYNSHENPEMPLVIGRACSGVVEAVGRHTKSDLEIGDEVWVASPWYDKGLGSELIVAPESRIGRKPVIIGFEGAASLPYSGCVALNALRSANLNELTCAGKRILVQDGCSPVGCVLTQLTKKWGAYVTATCNDRSVPVIKALGADDVIPLNADEIEQYINNLDPIYLEQTNFINQLSIRDFYDVIFITTKLNYNINFLNKFLINDNCSIVHTYENELLSDNFGFFTKIMFSFYVKIKCLTSAVVRTTPDWGGPHICYLALNRLADYVNDGILQTVVDQVYTPQDAERSITHICSEKAIGSTIITFR